MTDNGVTPCAILRIPSTGPRAFQAYEDAVLPLPRDHGATIQRRSHTEDGLTKIHVIWFPSASELDAHRADPRRSAHASLFDTSGAAAEVLQVADVGPRLSARD